VAATIYDYPALKRQFIATPGLSIRELCRRNGVPENSRMAVQRRATEEGWKAEREKVVERSTDRTIDLLADQEARRALRIAQVESNALDMADEMVDQVRGRLKKLHPVTKMVTRKNNDGEDEEVEEVVDYRPDLLVRPEDLGKLFKSLGEMRAVAAPPRGVGGTGGSGNGDGRNVNVSLPEGTELAIVARYVERVRNEGGPVDDFDAPAGDEAAPALPSGAPGASQGAV
jgi:hypothetical protein